MPYEIRLTAKIFDERDVVLGGVAVSNGVWMVKRDAIANEALFRLAHIVKAYLGDGIQVRPMVEEHYLKIVQMTTEHKFERTRFQFDTHGECARCFEGGDGLVFVNQHYVDWFDLETLHNDGRLDAPLMAHDRAVYVMPMMMSGHGLEAITERPFLGRAMV